MQPTSNTAELGDITQVINESGTGAREGVNKDPKLEGSVRVTVNMRGRGDHTNSAKHSANHDACLFFALSHDLQMRGRGSKSPE